ncbi:MAG TPA: PEGA domain-containing protein [Myxococcaceae bacterium]
MSKPPDEDEDQIFSGKALGEDGALEPAQDPPLLSQGPPAPTRPPTVPPFRAPPSPAPPMPGASLLDDPAWEPTLVSIPPRPQDVRPSGMELADSRPPPMTSDYVAGKTGEPPRFGSPDIPWGKWVMRVALLGVLGAGAWAVVSGKVPLGKFSFDLLRSGTKKDKEEPAEKRVGTPAPTLLVLSEPSGATVLVGGTEVGVTPWAGDNVWPEKEPLRIEVRKAGYRSWVGLAQGGQQATLEANLKKK